ncbi:MAG: hypothetical protein U0Q55_01075 [Vicinamibacterales bacterium]
MRATMVAALTLAVLAGQPGGVTAQPELTPSELADDTLAAALWRIAAGSGTSIGFQSIEPINPARGALSTALFEASHAAGRAAAEGAPAPVPPVVVSLDDALDEAIASNPRYDWNRVGRSVVVRPIGAWTDARDPLNRPVRHLRVERSTDTEILDSIHTGVYKPKGPIGRSVVAPFTVESGTIVDVLNTLVETAGYNFWQAGYRAQSADERTVRPDLSLILASPTGIRTAASSHVPGVPPSN